jgi:hypothetical protein
LQAPQVVVPAEHASLLASEHVVFASSSHTSFMQQAVRASPKSTEASHTLPAHVPELSLIADDVHEPLAAALHACLATQDSPSGTNPSLQAPQVVVPAEHAFLLALEHAILAAVLHTSFMQQAVELSPKSTEASHTFPAHVPELSLIADDVHEPLAAALHACLATQDSPSGTNPSLHAPQVAKPVAQGSLLALEHEAFAPTSHLSTQRSPVSSGLKPLEHSPQVSALGEHALLLALEHVALAASSHTSTQSSPSGLNPALHAPQVIEFTPSEHVSLLALEHAVLALSSHTSTQRSPVSSSLNPVKHPPQVSAPAEHATL